MRKVTYGGANSADNFITGPDEDVGWLRMTSDVQEIIKESWKGVDTMLMGRKTFEFGQKMGGGPAMKGIKSYVFSRTLKSVPEGVELVRADAVEFVREIKSGEGGDILVMGGGELGTALIEGGLVPAACSPARVRAHASWRRSGLDRDSSKCGRRRGGIPDDARRARWRSSCPSKSA